MVNPMNKHLSRWLIIITGPTATGKTSVAVSIAHHFKTSIISADSRQFYSEMFIGTARPSDDEMDSIPHYFSGNLSVREYYNVSRFERDVLNKLEELFAINSFVVMAGGSGLYINTICHGIDELPDADENLRKTLNHLKHTKGIIALQQKLLDLDPVYYHRVDLSNPKRLIRALEVCINTGYPYSSLRKNKPVERPFKTLKIGLNLPKEDLYQRIDKRVDIMMQKGLLEEAEQLYPFREMNALNTVGYRELFGYFDGATTLNDAVGKIKSNTRHYAKRQLTWFKKDKEITWFHPNDLSLILDFIDHSCQYNSITQQINNSTNQ